MALLDEAVERIVVVLRVERVAATCRRLGEGEVALVFGYWGGADGACFGGTLAKM